MKQSRPRPLPTLLVVLTAVAAVVVGLVGPASAAAPSCGITWGSLPRAQDSGDREVLTDVRAGRHACYDRLVVDLGGEDDHFGSYAVRYVRQVTEDGSGHAVALRGGAALQVIVKAPAYDEHGATYLPANPAEVVDVTGFSTFRQVAWAGTFEGQSTIGLGVRATLPFRVFFLTGAPYSDQGPRLVLDVAHRW
ncbi:MAG: uncharacterized protein JWR62_414 [Modestobacter sp.]|nr:uncharacterized protein [Modestobacter sp.]